MSVAINNLQIDESLNRLQAFKKSDAFDWQLAAYCQLGEIIFEDTDAVEEVNINRRPFLQTSLLAAMLLAQQQLNGVPAASSEDIYCKCSMQILESGRIKLGEILLLNQLPRVDIKAIDVTEESKAVTADKAELETIFNGLSKIWKDATGGLSVTKRRFSHPAYKAILRLGSETVPLILKELQQRPDWWFDALEFLTKENPAESADSFEQAASAWIQWGKNNRII